MHVKGTDWNTVEIYLDGVPRVRVKTRAYTRTGLNRVMLRWAARNEVAVDKVTGRFVGPIFGP